MLQLLLARPLHRRADLVHPVREDDHGDLAVEGGQQRLELGIRVVLGNAGLPFGRARLPVGPRVPEGVPQLLERLVPLLLLQADGQPRLGRAVDRFAGRARRSRSPRGACSVASSRVHPSSLIAATGPK